MNPSGPQPSRLLRTAGAASLALVIFGILALVAPAAGHGLAAGVRAASGSYVSGNLTDQQSGLPVAGATVRSSYGPTTVTNSTGGYVIAAPIGTVTLNFGAPGYHGISRSINVYGAVTGQNFLLPPYTYWVKGTVVGNPGAVPIPGATVVGPFNMKFIASSAGAFHFILENGTYSFTASYAGFQPKTVSVSVSGAPTSTFILMDANGTQSFGMALNFSAPSSLLGEGIAAGGVVAVVGFVVLRRQHPGRGRGGAPLAGLPSQQNPPDHESVRSIDRRALRRRGGRF